MTASNNFFQRIWSAFFPSATNAVPEGRQRSLAYLVGFDDTYIGRNYDLEITERPVRDPQRAKELIELVEYCPEIGLALTELADSVWSSSDGDDQGFRIGDCVDQAEEVPIDPEVQKILQRLIDDVIGGLNLELVPWRLCAFGDCFASLGVDLKAREIRSILFLPTWEMFRVEDDQGNLNCFEQRRYLTDGEALQFHPIRLVHWRYKRKSLYGQPLWNGGILEDWKNLREATTDLAMASRAIGANPNKHIMPCGYDEGYKVEYKAAYEIAKKQGQVLDFYLDNGADIQKVGQRDSDLSSMINNVNLWRSRVAMSTGLPQWMFGLQTGGAQDIAGQPALKYARQVNRLRMSIVDGIKQICDLELALKGIPRERWLYKIEFPTIKTDPYHETAQERQQAQQETQNQEQNNGGQSTSTKGNTP
jgi:hypothetical protein